MLYKIMRSKVLEYLKRGGVSMIVACVACFLLGVGCGYAVARKSKE